MHLTLITYGNVEERCGAAVDTDSDKSERRISNAMRPWKQYLRFEHMMILKTGVGTFQIDVIFEKLSADISQGGHGHR